MRFLITFIFLISLIGCSHYQMGQPGDNLDHPSVYLEPILNRSTVAQIRVPLAQAIRSEIASNGTLQIASDKKDAVYLVKVTVTDYQRQIAATQKNDTGRGYSFDITLFTAVTIVNQQTGETETVEFKAATTALSEPSLPDSEYQVLPPLLRNLAQQISQHLAYRW